MADYEPDKDQALVGVVAQALHAADGAPYTDLVPEHYYREARAVLREVGPVLLARGWDSAVEVMAYEDGTPVEVVFSNNPWRVS